MLSRWIIALALAASSAFAQGDGSTPLHWAAHQEDVETARPSIVE
jgi:hypothetical protein